MQKKLYRLISTFLFRYILFQAILGVAVLNGWLLAIIPVSGLLFALHQSAPRLKSLLPAAFLGNIVFMMIVISWFKNIDALGWQNIGPFDPNLVLMFVLFVISIFTSIFISAFWFFAFKLTSEAKFNLRQPSYIYAWSTCMMLVEIIRTTSFSLFVSHTNAPIEPSLNLFSVGPLIHNTPLSPLSRIVGFWGSSLVVYTTGAIFFIFARYFITRRNSLRNIRTLRREVILTAGVIIAVFGISLFSVGGSRTEYPSVDVIAVSQKSQDMLYLQRLSVDLERSKPDAPTVVVLPEYSGLIHPYSEASIFGPTYDSRDVLPKLLQGKPVYIVGTEDELSKNGRYVETYIVNSRLNKVKRAEKTFLIPGGEYIPPWIGAVIKRIDRYAVINFSSSRSRSVLAQNLPTTEYDPISRAVAVGPCSTVLTPFHFRKQVAEGAVLLTSNVSYEQFAHAPEYSAYARRFAKFTAYSTGRPFIIGARAGNAMIYDNAGKELASSEDNLTATHSFTQLSNKKNLYVILGDTVIVALLCVAALAQLYVMRLQQLRIQRRRSSKS